MKTALASAAVLLLGFFALAGITADFSVLTTEQARRQQVRQTRPAVIAAELVDTHGNVFVLDSEVKKSGKYWLIDFIYTRCNAVCRSQGTEFQRLQRAIAEQGLQDRVGLLSISFDPAHDTPRVLAQQAAHFGADPAVWRFATVSEAGALPALLAFFGITVIPDEWGGFQHNAALLLVTPDARLVRVMDIDADAWQSLLRQLRRGPT
jgi:protein SCO1/2